MFVALGLLVCLLLALMYVVLNYGSPWLFRNTTLVLLGGILLSGYFLPAIIGRHKRNARAILVLNLLLGWTILGWIGALIWALLRESPSPDTTPSRDRIEECHRASNETSTERCEQ